MGNLFKTELKYNNRAKNVQRKSEINAVNDFKCKQ